MKGASGRPAGADRQDGGRDDAAARSKGATTPRRPARTSSSRPTVASRSSPRTARRRQGRRTVDRALLSLGRAIERQRRRPRRASRTVGARRAAGAQRRRLDRAAAARRRGRGRAQGIRCPRSRVPISTSSSSMRSACEFTDLKVRDARERRRAGRSTSTVREVAGTANWSAPDAGAAERTHRRAALPARDAGSGAARVVASAERAKDAARRKRTRRPAIRGPRSTSRRMRSFRRSAISGGSSSSRSREAADWRIDRLVLANDAGRLEANGAWRVPGRAQQTKLDIILDAKDSGGVPRALRVSRRAAGRADEDRRPARVGGRAARVRLPVAERGRFTSASVRAGSRSSSRAGQAARRAVAAGAAATRHARLQRRLQRGLRVRRNHRQRAHRERRDGDDRPEARRVRPRRSTSPARPTSRRKRSGSSVRVQPSLSSSVSAGAALLFLANPLVGAVVGAGSLLAQTMLQDPIEKMFSYEYTVTGGWSDPVVARNGGGDRERAPRRCGAALDAASTDDGRRANDARRRGADGFRRRCRGESRAGGAADRARRRPKARASSCCRSISASSARARPTSWRSARRTARVRNRRSSRGSPQEHAHLARRRHRADRERRSGARAQRMPRLRSRRASASRATTRSTSSRSRAARSATTKAGRSSPAPTW